MRPDRVRIPIFFALAAIVACGSNDPASELTDSPRFRSGREIPELRLLEPGAGIYASERPTFDMQLMKRAIAGKLSDPQTAETYGSDAVLHLRHYFDNTGTDLVTDLPRLLRETQAGRDAFSAELAAAKAFAATLPSGNHSIVSSTANTVYVSASDSGNWNKAIAAYLGYTTADVQVSSDSSDRTFVMTLTYHLWDPYDWEPTDDIVFADPSTGFAITNDMMGRFHRQGLAREYLSLGEHQEQVSWRIP